MVYFRHIAFLLNRRIASLADVSFATRGSQNAWLA
jgi:hypothetical protein